MRCDSKSTQAKKYKRYAFDKTAREPHQPNIPMHSTNIQLALHYTLEKKSEAVFELYSTQPVSVLILQEGPDDYADKKVF